MSVAARITPVAPVVSPVAPVDEPAHTYRVYVRPYPGWWRRWRGRVITQDGDGRHRFWPWRYGRSRDALVKTLWDEVHRDIEWCDGSAVVEVLEVTSTLT